MDAVAEFYESGNAPHEALGRAARRLANGGAIYLGGGVGVEKQRGAQGVETYRVTKGTAGSKEHPGPLAAVIDAFTRAGASSAGDTPGGSSKVADPAAAARLRELIDQEAEAQKDIARYTRRLASAKKDPAPVWPSPTAVDDDRWEQRRIDELKVELSQIAAERAKLMATGKVEEGNLSGMVFEAYAWWAWEELLESGLAESVKTATLAVKHAPIGKGGSNWITKSKPGNSGQLPAYIQNVRNAIMRDGTEEATAHALAIGKVEDWAAGKGNVHPEVRAAAKAAIAELKAMGAKSKAKSKASKISESAGGVLDSLLESFSYPNAQRQAVAAGGKAPAAAKRSPSVASFDKTKHPRGSKGTSTGGKFVSSTAGSSSQVRAVQHRVGATVDGKFGKQTTAAVRAFQARHGLEVDGVVGRQTLAALAGRKNASSVRPGSLTSADTKELNHIRQGQVRRRAAVRSGGGVLV